MLKLMQKITLPNGLTVIHQPKKSNSIVVELQVNVGSNDEGAEERGISHFLEHLLFEGTEKRPTNQLISNEIESIGGDFNAYTTNERTCFYVKVLKKHFVLAAEIISDIMQHSLFKEEHIEREKNVVMKEIDMINDEPRFYQWLFLQKNLFKNHPCRYPTYGDKAIIKNLTKQKICSYFKKHYRPENMTLSVVGDASGWRRVIAEKFIMERGNKTSQKKVKEYSAGKGQVVREKRKISNTYTVIGFKTVPRSHRDSYVLEVINGILGRGQSGRMFAEIRSRHGLAYDVGSQNIGEITYGYFAVYATVDKKNVNLVKNLIDAEIGKLRQVTEKDLQEAKYFIEGNYLLELEDTQKVADQILFWEQVSKASLMNSFVNQVKKVTVNDVKRVASKYFRKGTLVVLEGK
ncbi:MAG TPA: pitrilysin family protein [Candidatus Nanoarchaeia archaeon]|nr:pitrilysin family protein [Candidatus Nanoarchaeia archaeon]